MDESHGTAVTPQSLYEAQLEKRLGHLPPWIEAYITKPAGEGQADLTG